MPYIKTIWTDETPATTPLKYKISQASIGDVATDATIELVTSVTAGTQVNAYNLNKIENALETTTTLAEGAIPKSLVTTVGDLIYATASAVLARLAKPSVDSVLKMTNSGLPSWVALTEFVSSLIYRRQGGSATVWSTQGTNNYTPSTAKIQTGVIRISLNSATTGNVTVNFPVAFTYAPQIFLSPLSSPASTSLGAPYAQSITNSSFSLNYTQQGSSSFYTVDIAWMAIGE